MPEEENKTKKQITNKLLKIKKERIENVILYAYVILKGNTLMNLISIFIRFCTTRVVWWFLPQINL